MNREAWDESDWNGSPRRRKGDRKGGGWCSIELAATALVAVLALFGWSRR